MKKIRGYISGGPFMGERVPQHVQNVVIRDFCKKNSLEYLLSTSEYRMKNSFLILKDLVSNLKNIDGIVAYSIFQLPPNSDERKKILTKIINKKKFIKFAVEQMKVSNKEEIDHIEIIWQIKKALPFCATDI